MPSACTLLPRCSGPEGIEGCSAQSTSPVRGAGPFAQASRPYRWPPVQHEGEHARSTQSRKRQEGRSGKAPRCDVQEAATESIKAVPPTARGPCDRPRPALSPRRNRPSATYPRTVGDRGMVTGRGVGFLANHRRSATSSVAVPKKMNTI